MKEMLININYEYPDQHHKNVIKWLKANPVYVMFAEVAKDRFLEKQDSESWALLIDLFFASIPTYTDNGAYIEDYVVLHLYQNWDDIMN